MNSVNLNSFYTHVYLYFSSYLLLAKKTTGSYDMQSENGIKYYLVIDIRKVELTNNQAALVKQTIRDTMDELDFDGNVVERNEKISKYKYGWLRLFSVL